MSYTTILYAVDLDHIQAAVGSNDAALVERIQRQLLEERGDDPGRDAALRELIFGEFHRRPASDYAYALQHLCKARGKYLDDDDMLGDLEPLELDSPLSHWRMPVNAPKPDNFPFVSYLTSEEVAAEVARLESMDLSFPDDEDIEEARKSLLACLKEAAQENQAVIAFYY